MPHPSRTAVTYPHKPAIVMGSGEDAVLTYAELDRHSCQGARLLRALGLDRGDRVAVLAGNSPGYLEFCWAAQRAGLVFVPVPLHARREEVAAILEDSGARFLLVAASLSAEALALPLDAPGVDHFYMLGGIAEGFESWEEGIDRQDAVPPDDEAGGVPMFYAAGAGEPLRGALPTPLSDDVDTPPALAGGVGVAFGFSEETVFLSPAPLYTPASLLYNMMALYQGGTCVLMESFEPEAALALIEEHRVTHSLWVPSMFGQLLRLPQSVRQRYDLGSMQYALHAGAPCPVAIKQQMIDWWGPVLVEYYAAGASEGATVIDSADWLAHPGSVGRAFLGQLEIVDADGALLPPGQIGQIRFAGDEIGTGDSGYLDAEGYLYVTDRSSDSVTSDGVTVYPQDLESLLMTHAKVADVAVFGLPDEGEGEQLQALVEPVNWADATDETAFEIMAWLRERLEDLVMPHKLDFRERLPREEDGRVYRQRLKEEFRGGSRDDTPPE
ncbi:AMP-binding protein [Haliea sp. E17]|uniref:AMP-binding protein n=1 Tax=Haliea sp. E17 TaxID=3401576 RepID=UPI003AAD0F49